MALLCALPVHAQQVTPCDWQASAENIPEPWEKHSRTFANGAVRLAVIDTVEPAAGAFWLLILSPPHDELGARQCRLVGGRDMGFGGMAFAGLTASYEPSTGLSFSLPVRGFDGERALDRTLRVTLDQATGAIAAVLLP